MIDVVCGVLIKDGQCFIASRLSGINKGTFEFPGGKIEPGETGQEALIREWKEECEIEIEDVAFFMESMDWQEEEIRLLCYTCTSKEKPTTLHVHSQGVWTTPEHIYDYPFFEADRRIVEKLIRHWPQLIQQYK